MSRNSTRILLADMLDAAREANGYVQHLDLEQLHGHRLLQHGLVRCIEIIGEAASRVNDEFRAAHPELPWSKMIGMRNRLVHAYFEIDLDVVWSTTTNELPILIALLEKLLGDFGDD